MRFWTFFTLMFKPLLWQGEYVLTVSSTTSTCWKYSHANYHFYSKDINCDGTLNYEHQAQKSQQKLKISNTIIINSYIGLFICRLKRDSVKDTLLPILQRETSNFSLFLICLGWEKNRTSIQQEILIFKNSKIFRDKKFWTIAIKTF